MFHLFTPAFKIPLCRDTFPSFFLVLMFLFHSYNVLYMFRFASLPFYYTSMLFLFSGLFSSFSFFFPIIFSYGFRLVYASLHFALLHLFTLKLLCFSHSYYIGNLVLFIFLFHFYFYTYFPFSIRSGSLSPSTSLLYTINAFLFHIFFCIHHFLIHCISILIFFLY